MSAKLKLPKIIGHRGAKGYAPENTLVSIHTAADMGVEWVELDVKLTRDSVPIIFHDDDLARTTNGAGLVAQTDYADIQALEAGSHFADSFAGTAIPTLEDALEVIIDRGLGLNLEIKPCAGREVETAEHALDILTSIWDEDDKILISSFQHVSLETAMDMAPNLPRGFLMETEWQENWQDFVSHLKASTVNVNGNEITREEIEQIIDETGLPILAYTINEPDRARHLQAWGVAGFFSDVPDIVKDGLFSVH